MQKWEYKAENIMVEEDYSDLPFAPTSWPTPKPDKIKLHQLGEEGWGLIQIVDSVAYFKRLVDEASLVDRNYEVLTLYNLSKPLTKDHVETIRDIQNKGFELWLVDIEDTAYFKRPIRKEKPGLAEYKEFAKEIILENFDKMGQEEFDRDFPETKKLYDLEKDASP